MCNLREINEKLILVLVFIFIELIKLILNLSIGSFNIDCKEVLKFKYLYRIF